MEITARHFDSSLGSWTHAEWRPASGDPLGWAVDRVWDFDGMAAHPQERVFPSGHVELILQLDDRYLDVVPDGVRTTPAVCVTGVQTGPVVVRAPRSRVRVLAIRLHPAGAWAALGSPLHELADRTADLSELAGRDAVELAERCAGPMSGAERVRLALAWVRRRILGQGMTRSDPAVRWIARCIAESAGRERIASLRARAGLSDARLAALFREQVGVTPKRMARIHRFGRALALLSGSAEPLARIAHHAGYYDQPHMNADFRELAGLTPRELAVATRYPSSTSLAEAI